MSEPAGERLRALLIEDSADDAELIERELGRAGFDSSLRRVETLEDLRSAIDEGRWDIVLSDDALPSFDAASALETVERSSADVPLIVVSGAIGEDAAVALMRQGAADYVRKDRLDRLGPAIRHTLRECEARAALKQAEDAMRASERRLAEAQRLAGIGSWEWDIAADRVTWSDELYRLFGVERSEFGATYEDYLALVHPEDRERADATVRRAFADHAPFGFEHRVLRPDGTIRHLSARGGVVVGPDGNPAAMFGTTQDVTDRRLAESRFRGLLEAAPDAMVVVDAAGRIALVNAQTENLFGYGREELIGQPIETLVPADLHAVHRHHRDGYADDPHARPMGANLDLRAVRRDGTEFPVEISLSPLETEEGQLVTAAVRDISDRRRIELERTHLAAIVESSDDAIIGKTLDGTIVSWNRGAEQLYGYGAEEMIGRSVSVLLPPDRPDELRELLHRIRHGEEVEAYETVRVHRSGRLVDVSVSVSPVVDGAGEVEGAATIARDITDRKRVESQLQFLADHDVLTGLFNRRRFIEELTRRIELADRYGRPGAVLMLDVDNFKEINDTLGHRAGDDTVRAVASMLRRRLRSTDVLARLGGDEFAVVLPEADPDQAVAVASDLLEGLRGVPLFVAGRRARVTASAGVAMFEPRADVDAEQMLAFADLAMYEAKEAGRDRLAVYSQAAGREALFEARFSSAQRIRAALESEALTLHLQPIMRLTTEEVSQCEMLLRMEGDEGELIPPGAFLGAAERSGMITELDRWVVRNAIDLAAREREAGRWKSFEINLSGRSIGDAELPQIIASGVEEHDLDPAALIFEVTETAAIANMEEAREFARALKRLGCRFALDDFGAGFGSFYYLKYLPLDFLKIDGDFIRDLPSSPVDQVLVRGVVEVARGLGMETIAEFVEDAETLELVAEYEVDFGQGFYIGEPRPAGEPLESA